MLRPSRPMMRPLRSSLGRSTTETVVSIACSAPQRWIASVMYCLARSTAVSRASASSRFSRLAESWRASPSICLISSSLASSAVRPATRSSSCLCCATSCSHFGGRRGGAVLAFAERLVAAGQLLLEPLDRRLPLGGRRLAPGQRLLERRRLLAVVRAPGARPPSGCRAPSPWPRAALPSCVVSASRSASWARRCACSSARPMVSAAMRLRLATQTANIAPATTTATTAGMMIFAKSDSTRDVLSRCRGQTPR